MTQCIMCGWLLNFEHAFNVNCPVANAENDQIVAEVRELQAQPWTDEDQALVNRGMEAFRDVMAFERFKRDVRWP